MEDQILCRLVVHRVRLSSLYPVATSCDPHQPALAHPTPFHVPSSFLPGISGKSQILFTIVYISRYLDLFTTYVSLYNSVMKLVFLAGSGATIYLIYLKFKATYDHNHDSFRIEFLLIPCAILALLVNHDFTVMEVLWTFSIYLESVAILPQLFLVSKTGEAESITSHYLFALGSYRALYLLNWVYRYFSEAHYDLIVIFAGVVQTILYCDFFYLYITKGE